MSAWRVTIYRDEHGEWRYRVQARNGWIIATSEEGFTQKRTIQKRIAKYWPDAEVIEQ